MKKSILVAAIKENAKNFLGLALLLVMSSQTALATVEQHFASPSGAGDCSQANPCSIATAVTTMSDPHGIVYLAQGSYTSSTNEVIFIDKNISLLGGWDGSVSSPIVRDSSLHVSTIDGQSSRRGVKIGEGHSVTIEDITVANCVSSSHGAGLYVNNSSSLTLNNVTFFQNYTDAGSADGGGAYVHGGILNIANSSFIKNSAADGGGLATDEANATIQTSLFEENDAHQSNSAFYFFGTSESAYNDLNLTQSTFTNNSKKTSINGADSNNYSTFGTQYADAIIYNSRFENNDNTDGTSINIQKSSLTFINNIVSNNKDNLSALYIYDSPKLLIANSMFTDNNVTSPDTTSSIFIQQGFGTIDFNTIANNDVDTAMRIGGKGSSDNLFMHSNIITGHDLGILLADNSSLHISHTLWGEGASANGTNITSTGTLTQSDDFVGDPAYVDEINGNYHIKAISDAIDKGEGKMPFDIDMDERPQGSADDIGADEFVNNAVSPALIMYLLN